VTRLLLRQGRVSDRQAGTSPEALMTRAGHSSYATTKRYVDLSGERFRDEADREEQRYGWSGTKNGYQDADPSPVAATEEAATPLS
jgi:hypothetical protein